MIGVGFCFWKFHHKKVAKQTISECQTFAKNKQNDQSVDCYKNVIGNEPQNLTVKAELANVYLNQKKYDQASKLLTEANTADPNNAFLLNSLGNSLREEGKIGEAEKSYLDAISKGNVDSIINLVTLYNTTGQFDKSIEILNTQIKANPQDKTLVSLLVSTYSKAGDPKKAQSLIDSMK